MNGWSDTVDRLIIALIGAGGATFVWTLVRSYIAIRDSAEGREDKAVARLEKFEENCRHQLEHERKITECERAMGAYWYRCTTILQRTLDIHGIKMPNMPKRPEGMKFTYGDPDDGDA